MTIALTWWYGLMEWITGLRKKQNLTRKLAIQLPITYHNHRTLTVDQFIDCYVDNKLEVLVTSGNPTESELNEYWQYYLMLHYEMIGSIESRQYFTMQKQIEVKAMQLDILERALNIYLAFRSKKKENESIGQLKYTISKLGFHFESSLLDEQILKLYDRHIKNESIEMQLLTLRLKEQLDRANQDDKKPTRSSFMETIIVMAKNGFHVKLTDSNEYYCATIKLYNDYCRQQEKIYNNIKGNNNGSR